MKYIVLMMGLAALNACHNQAPAEKKPATATEPAVNTDQKTVLKTDSVPETLQIDTAIHFHFEPDSSSTTARGMIRSASDRITAYLPVDRVTHLTAQLVPADKDLNIRFSQIVMPDGKTDGPFGQKFTYTLRKKGMYKIIIAPSNMADGKTKGEFIVRIGTE